MKVPATQKVLDAADLAAMHAAVDEGWLTHGPRCDQFEADIARQFGLRCAAFVNSGSSANLLALAAVKELGGLQPGDEVVTCAAGFPTTVNPIVQLGLTPVFVDCELGTYNADTDVLWNALSRPRARALILAHTLGNPLDIDSMEPLFKKYSDVDFIEDCCDALGSTIDGRHVGQDGSIATCSFYPAHHITTGEGGAVLTGSPKLDALVRSYRGWGRDCWCPTGKDNTCGKRFEQRCGGLPDGYDHKHVFSRLGWNMKNTEVAAALGSSQLKRLPEFMATRRRNFGLMRKLLDDLQGTILLPQATPGSAPCWFGFPITLLCRLDRRAVVAELEAAGVGTRPIFAGNIVRQPAYAKIKYEVVGDLANADTVMRSSFYVGCHHCLSEEQVAYSAAAIRKAVTR